MLTETSARLPEPPQPPPNRTIQEGTLLDRIILMFCGNLWVASMVIALAISIARATH